MKDFLTFEAGWSQGQHCSTRSRGPIDLLLLESVAKEILHTAETAMQLGSLCRLKMPMLGKWASRARLEVKAGKFSPLLTVRTNIRTSAVIPQTILVSLLVTVMSLTVISSACKRLRGHIVTPTEGDAMSPHKYRIAASSNVSARHLQPEVRKDVTVRSMHNGV